MSTLKCFFKLTIKSAIRRLKLSGLVIIPGSFSLSSVLSPPLFITAALAFSGLDSAFTQERHLEGEEVFEQNFPLILSFRNDRYGLPQGYAFWEEAHLPYHGITKKYLMEEINVDALSAQFRRADDRRA